MLPFVGRRFSVVAACCLLAGFATVSIVGCGGSKGEEKAGRKVYQADNKSNSGNSNSDPVVAQQPANQANTAGPVAGRPSDVSTGGNPAKPPALSSDELTSYEIPNGTPDEILEFAASLLTRRPQGANQEDLLADGRKMWNAAKQAADKVLAGKVTPEQRRNAINTKIGAYTNLASFGEQNAEADLRKFCLTMTKDKDPIVAGRSEIMLFGLRINDVMRGRVEDMKGFTKEIEQLIANKQLTENKELAEQVFYFSQQATLVLNQRGERDAAQGMFDKIGKAFITSKIPELAREARNLQHRSTYGAPGFDQKEDAALRGLPNSVAPFMDAVTKLLQVNEPGKFVFERVSRAAQMMEITQHFAESKKIFDMVEKAFAGTPDKRLAEQVKQSVDYGRRRASLIGKPFVVEGTNLDGSKFDWTSYAGKVVLVDFWATWCGPCLAEIPNIKKNYEAYRAKGFEVVGVNLDDQPGQVRQFLDSRPLPWRTVLSAQPNASGFSNPLAIKCGVEAIPFIVLVGKDGNVVALHTRGPELGKQLEKLLGPPPVDTKKTGSLQAPSEEFVFVTYDEQKGDADVAKDEGKKAAKKLDLDDINPYLADESLTPPQLVEFIFDMQDKPKSIRGRPGFAEALVDAAERLMASQAKEKLKTIGVMTKFEVLHDRASFGDDKADTELIAFVKKMAEDKRPKVAKEVEFLTLERRVIDVDKMDMDKVPALLAEVEAYLKEKELTARHLRLASSTVHAINRFEDAKKREKYFGDFGKMFATSKSKELASYGKKLTKAPGGAPSQFVGKPMELEGTTTLGTPFDWKSYRGKVVLVDFWATWCGPCRREMPKVKALYAELKAKGFEVVAVSLDKDLEALGRYLDENAIEWTNLSGEETQDLAKKYGVRGIPTMMLVDQQGKIIDVSHNVAKLAPQARQLLAAKKK